MLYDCCIRAEEAPLGEESTVDGHLASVLLGNGLQLAHHELVQMDIHLQNFFQVIYSLYHILTAFICNRRHIYLNFIYNKHVYR